ncbi:hypothetical protein [Marinobacter sp. es.048]|uniref:hypothetical protein n=1 Tax=Marinobacter sp. es.048 TaxID=1761795 RepID=UPI001E427E85|nr:hypothetical protein [Marinobacter sp. es.048]
MKEFIIRRYRSDQSATSGRQTVLRIDDEGKVLFADHQAEAVLGYESSREQCRFRDLGTGYPHE